MEKTQEVQVTFVIPANVDAAEFKERLRGLYGEDAADWVEDGDDVDVNTTLVLNNILSLKFP